MQTELKHSTYTQTVYICESCGDEHYSEHRITTCHLCGKECCDTCGKELLYLVPDGGLEYKTSPYCDDLYVKSDLDTVLVCADCYEKHKNKEHKLQEQYDKKIKQEVEKFNKKISKINNQFKDRLK